MSAANIWSATVRVGVQLRSQAALYNKYLLGATFGLTLASLAGYAFGLVRDIIVTGSFGLGADLDSYLLAITVPTVLVSIIGGTIDSTVIPVYMEMRERDEQSASNFASSLLTYAILTSIALNIVLYVLAAPTIRLIAPGLDQARALQTENLYVFCLPFISFSIIAYILRSLLNAHHLFVLPALGPLLAAVVALISVLLLN